MGQKSLKKKFWLEKIVENSEEKKFEPTISDQKIKKKKKKTISGPKFSTENSGKWLSRQKFLKKNPRRKSIKKSSKK